MFQSQEDVARLDIEVDQLPAVDVLQAFPYVQQQAVELILAKKKYKLSMEPCINLIIDLLDQILKIPIRK